MPLKRTPISEHFLEDQPWLPELLEELEDVYDIAVYLKDFLDTTKRDWSQDRNVVPEAEHYLSKVSEFIEATENFFNYMNIPEDLEE